MTKKTLVATVVFIFLIVSNVWASLPSGAKMDEYMKKRYVVITSYSKNYYVDFKHVIAASCKGVEPYTMRGSVDRGRAKIVL